MGDFNAKIGSDNIGYEEVMGRHGLGAMNDNGERLADLCALNKLVLGGSVFPHRRIHKVTWLSPAQSTENQINHFHISKKFRRSLRDVRVKRGADVASNHHLVIANLKLKLKRNWAGAAPQRNRYDIGCLKDVRKLDEFRVTVRNRSQILQDLMEDDKTVDSSCKVVKESFVTACKAVLGPKKYHYKDWISAETLDKIRVRKEKNAAVNSSRTRAERSKALKEHSNAHKSTKKSMRADKTKYINGIAEAAEQAARAGNMKGLYDTTKKLAGKFGNPERRVQDKTGSKIVGEEQQKPRWVEHFEELLNRSPPQNPPVILPAA